MVWDKRSYRRSRFGGNQGWTLRFQGLKRLDGSRSGTCTEPGERRGRCNEMKSPCRGGYRQRSGVEL